MSSDTYTTGFTNWTEITAVLNISVETMQTTTSFYFEESTCLLSASARKRRLPPPKQESTTDYEMPDLKSMLYRLSPRSTRSFHRQTNRGK